MKNETLENVAGWLAGVTTGASLTLLFVAMSAPVVETLQKFLS